jgi:hypothetical protein
MVSSIDYSEQCEQLAVGHLDGTVNFYRTCADDRIAHSIFHNWGILHRLQWNPVESQQVGRSVFESMLRRQSSRFSCFLRIKID